MIILKSQTKHIIIITIHKSGELNVRSDTGITDKNEMIAVVQLALDNLKGKTGITVINSLK